MEGPTATWHAFRQHAEGCAPCERVRLGVCAGCPPAMRMAEAFATWWETACDAGRPLLEAWHDACEEVLERDRQTSLWGQRTG